MLHASFTLNSDISTYVPHNFLKDAYATLKDASNDLKETRPLYLRFITKLGKLVRRN